MVTPTEKNPASDSRDQLHADIAKLVSTLNELQDRGFIKVVDERRIYGSGDTIEVIRRTAEASLRRERSRPRRVLREMLYRFGLVS